MTGVLHIPMLRKKMLLTLLTIFPWVFMGIGGFVNLYDPFRSSLVLSFLVFVAGIVFYFTDCRPRCGEKNREFNASEFFGLNYFYFFVVAFYLVYDLRLFSELSRFDFDFLLMRNFFFSTDEDSYNILYGIPALKAFYWYFVSPFAIAFLICCDRWGKREYLLLLLFALANTFEGGRVALYKIIIIYVFSLLVKGRGFDNNKIGKYLAFFLFAIFFLVSISRFSGAGDLGLLDLILDLGVSIFNYHSIQLGVLREASNLPLLWGGGTGLVTLFTFVLGYKSSEGEMINYLGSVRFITQGGDGPYNAFGTSLVYFVSPFGDLGIPLFFIFFCFIYIAFCVIGNSLVRKNLQVFLLYSFYFSAFTPFVFGFAWYVLLFSVLFISIFMTVLLRGVR